MQLREVPIPNSTPRQVVHIYLIKSPPLYNDKLEPVNKDNNSKTITMVLQDLARELEKYRNETWIPRGKAFVG